jgi:ribosomal protein S18 acetylase RimI-like enzyme
MEQPIIIQSLHASQAGSVTDIHLRSQKDTFLTSLGADFLTVLYSQISRSPYSFSYAALYQDELVGFIVGASHTGALFKDVIFKQPFRLSWLVFKQALKRPLLLWQSLKTLADPGQLPDHAPSAELLALAVSPPWRNRQIGSCLLRRLIQELKAAQVEGMVVTVDGHNDGALRFYQRHGFKVLVQTQMYGRPMVHLVLEVAEQPK